MDLGWDEKSSTAHWEVLKVYKEMDRQDAAAAASGTIPEYQRTGIVDMSRRTPATPKSGSKGGSGGGRNSGSSNKTSGSYYQ
jgi:hypothetical protein